ncbi:IPT/TIG domain-containing protein [Gemmatimonas sp.]|uniref:IPT/TIG domain-containing protein n=1 Tax=Gemmatimonas sp. TaxID=1962908 RepID=UPI0025BC95C9|nr:IPT/TIG domain-containing protein [Gemmatimonas sp.]
MSTRPVPAFATAMWLVACHARPGGAPLLTSVTPTAVTLTGGAVAMLTVRGRGFDSLNTVHFGRLRVPGVPRTNDSTMRFAVPADDAFLPGRGGAPVLPLASGTYDLRVENASGTSNALAVTVTAAQGAR